MSSNGGWLVDQRTPLTSAQLDQLDRELADAGDARGGTSLPTVALSVHDVVIHDTRKWFGEADIRLDALVITGYGEVRDPGTFYMPKTAAFGRIKDGDKLPIGSGGLLAFHGTANHFLDILIMVSRDRKDTDDLATLMTSRMQSPELKGAVGALAGLAAAAAPPVAAVTAAIGAAGVIGDFAYRVLRAATGSTIGLYRNSHLQYRDGFGIGPHPGPAPEAFRVNDLSFRYEIALEQ